MRQRRRIFGRPFLGRHRLIGDRIVRVQRTSEAVLGLAVTAIEQSDPKAPAAVGIAQSPAWRLLGAEDNQPFRNAQSIDFARIFSAFLD
jgi:hypothetical protein